MNRYVIGCGQLNGNLAMTYINNSHHSSCVDFLFTMYEVCNDMTTFSVADRETKHNIPQNICPLGHSNQRTIQML